MSNWYNGNNTKCKTVKSVFDPYGIHLTTVGHYLKAVPRVQNDAESNILGRKK
ncbi:hypothetical protein [Fusibacter sp. 3D3]|uniref:hypothetical protein n=1 Tax=Fusibacter sp. 3D3 TaxID=1048380 RepID=UPI000858AD67|nr:hypothetical protein [Fusibacter sp. 3D3]GAU76456.1 hypothetical protein F3D3_1053 [Fusibacter sp. 3D3]